GLGNFVIFLFILYALHHFVIAGVITHFQTDLWPNVQRRYKQLVSWCLASYRPIWISLAVVGLFIFSLVFTAIRKPPVVFFPQGDPNYIYEYIRMATGTDQIVTDPITRIVEERVQKVVGKDNPIVESIISNVAIGASEDPMEGGGTLGSPHLGKVSVAFVKFAQRDGQSTKVYMDKIKIGRAHV